MLIIKNVGERYDLLAVVDEKWLLIQLESLLSTPTYWSQPWARAASGHKEFVQSLARPAEVTDNFSLSTCAIEYSSTYRTAVWLIFDPKFNHPLATNNETPLGGVQAPTWPIQQPWRSPVCLLPSSSV